MLHSDLRSVNGQLKHSVRKMFVVCKRLQDHYGIGDFRLRPVAAIIQLSQIIRAQAW
jgi:hypothetical protein